jgi:hypothetical protein
MLYAMNASTAPQPREPSLTNVKAQLNLHPKKMPLCTYNTSVSTHETEDNPYCMDSDAATYPNK